MKQNLKLKIMEINVIKKGEVQVILTGKEYIFKNNWYGILAVATRKGYAPEDMHHFTIQVGNEYCVGSSYYNDTAVLAMVKRYINKEESRHVETTTTYDILHTNLDRCYIDVQVIYC